MKRMLLLSVLFLTLLSCGKDEEDGGGGSCTNADLIGTYSGNAECDGDTPTAADVMIVDRSGKLFYIDSDGQEYAMTVDGCKFTIPKVDIIFASVSGSGTLNGKELSTSFVVDLIGIKSTCKFKGTKK